MRNASANYSLPSMPTMMMHSNGAESPNPINPITGSNLPMTKNQRREARRRQMEALRRTSGDSRE